MKGIIVNMKKYVLNTRTSKLHIYGKCCKARNILESDSGYKFYNYEEDVIKENQNYIARCKNCFRNI